MNIKKFAFVFSAFVFGMMVYAQTVSFHGYVDYTNMAVGKNFFKDTKGEWDSTKASAEFGSFYNGRVELNTYIDASCFHFVLGMRLNSSLGNWYDNYSDVSDSNGKFGILNYFHQGNLRVELFKGQVQALTGKFEDWNNGYIANGYVFEGQNIKNLADRGIGQHFSGVELLPFAIPNLSVIVGLPILPVSGNGINSAEYNNWDVLYKKIKMMAKYKFDHGEIISAGWRPETHYEGTDNYSADSYFGEAFIQLNSPKATENFGYNVSYDLRYREIESLEKIAFMHYLGLSAQYKMGAYWIFAVENRSAYATNHYITENNSLFYNNFGVTAIYSIPNTNYQIGLRTAMTYALDSSGSLFSTDARISGNYSDDFAMTTDWMPFAPNPTAGSVGHYIGFYGNPYFQKNFRNGNVFVGVEMQFTKFKTTDETRAFGYRIPLGLKFYL